MNVQIDKDAAAKTLLKSFSNASASDYTPASKFSEEISSVIAGTHLTYRYVLVTGLLAKAVHRMANPLVMQAGSRLKGAFDARSLCHHVFVPFEQKNMANALGGSNEPYLNKPARFTELSKGNAVRRGKDKAMLNLLCTFLPKIANREDAFCCLCDAIYYALERLGTISSLLATKQKRKAVPYEILGFLTSLIKESMEGETLVLSIGAMMQHLSPLWGDSYGIRVHPVNQAGSSSRQFSDIDVYFKGNPIYAIEAKDKHFTSEDVQHAVRKISESDYKRLMFVMGPHAQITGSDYNEEVEKSADLGVFLAFYKFDAFASSIFSLSPEIESANIIEFMIKTAIESRFKDSTVKRITNLAREHGLIS